MQFIKMHGLGNNYIFFNLLDDWPVSLEESNLSTIARKVSDVNFGVGSDGMILICPSSVAAAKMRIFNKDGSEAKTCGNGLRCVARILVDQNYVTTNSFTIETLSGVVSVEVEKRNNQVHSILVNMGKPKLLKGLIPMLGPADETALHEKFTLLGNDYFFTCLSMGNPHAILFVRELEDVSLEEIGPLMEHHTKFSEGVNVSVIQILNKKEMNHRVWERGSQITLACGTGACASVVAATLHHLVEKNESILVHLQGGDLLITWDERGDVWMQGEATYICNGQLEI